MLKCNTLLAVRGVKSPFYLGNVGLKNTALAALVATVAMAGASSAAVTGIFNTNGNDVLGLDPFTLAPNNGGAETTSNTFAFLGVGDSNETFDFVFTGPAVITIGNLVEPSDYANAKLLIDGAEIADFIAAPDTHVTYAVAGNFTLTTDIDLSNSASLPATFDFTVSAVPLPAAGLLLLGGIAGLGFVSRKRKAA